MRFVLGLLLVSLWCTTSLHAQHENDWWYFGYGANMHFTDNGVKSDTVISTMRMLEGVASISHPISGDLLFYSDGMTIWDKDHAPMPNGTNLSGHNSSSQSVITFPVPGDRYRYYVFTIDDGQMNLGRNGLRYSIVDIRLNFSKGDVEPNNRNKLVRAPMGERLSAVKHATLDAYWVVAEDFNNSFYHAYLVDSNGIHAPVLSPIGISTRSGIVPGGIEIGTLNFNLQGDQMAVCRAERGWVLLYDFDASTGRISKLRRKKFTTPYAAEFSPDGSLLYVTDINTLYQIPTDSRFTQGRPYRALFNLGSVWSAIQLGVDGKLYFLPMYGRKVCIIHNPDVPGVGCNVDFFGHAIPKMQATAGLPNLVFSSNSLSKFDFDNNCAGKYAQIAVKNTTYIDSLRIDFGDPSSGAANFSTNPIDSHYYANPGKYAITGILYTTHLGKWYSDTIMDSIEILSPPVVHLGSDTAFCKGPTFVLEMYNQDWTYVWDNGSKLRKRWVRQTGVFWVEASNVCGTGRDSIYVQVDDSVTNIFEADTFYCSGDSLMLSPGVILSNMVWNTGSKAKSIIVKQPGKYWINAENSCTKVSDTINVEEIEFPVNYFTSDTILCVGDTLEVGQVANATKFLWNTGDTTSSIKIYQTGNYWVRAENKCGIDNDTIDVYFDFLPKFPIRDKAICEGEKIEVEINLPHSTKFVWNTGHAGSVITIKDSGTYEVFIENVCGKGSERFHVAKLKAPESQLASSYGLCSDVEINVDAKLDQQIRDYTSVEWSTGSTKERISINEVGDYWLKLDNRCGTVKAHFEVTENGAFLSPEESQFTFCEDDLQLDFRRYKARIEWFDGDSSEQRVFNKPGTYGLSYIDSVGCENAIDILVDQCSSPMYIPNSFTPNYDGNNEGFKVYKIGVSQFLLRVFDRWGNLVYESNDINEAWEGTDLSGASCPVGTYVYKLVYSYPGEEELRHKTGEVHLIR